MRIVGEWRRGDDGTTRPIVQAKVQTAAGTLQGVAFLLDSGADRTVFSAGLLRELGLTAVPAGAGVSLEGVGGGCGFVVVRTLLQMTCDDGGVANMRGDFAAFTELSATDISILGRDILNHFDVILSRQRDEVLLLAQKHRYRVEQV